VYLPKIGFVRVKIHREFDGCHVTQLSVKRYADQWVVNITVKGEETEMITSSIERMVGIDVGLNTFAARREIFGFFYFLPDPHFPSRQK
jgi:putative transposase